MSNETNTPDWATAPEWAQWFAIDKDGNAFFYDKKPKPFVIIWGREKLDYKFLNLGLGWYAANWQNSLQRRPENV